MLREAKDLKVISRRKPNDPERRVDQYRIVFERYPHPAWVLDRATLRFLAVNDAAVSKYLYSRDEFLRMSYLDIHLPEDASTVQRSLINGQPNSPGIGLWRHKKKSGDLFDVEAAWIPVPFDRVPAILLTADSTHRSLRRLLQETESGRERLEALSRRLVDIQETERSEIARELHDEVGQLLTGLKLMLSADEREPQPGLAGSRREQMLQIVNELMDRTRNISMDLRPPMLDQLGLLSALVWHFERFTEQTRIRVSFSHVGADSRFPRPVETAAFRLIQEALTNAARYAGAEVVEVEVQADSKFLKLRVEDRGSGFDQEAARAGRSAGLTGMEERAHLLGGHLTIESSPALGTRLLAALPLRSTAPGVIP